jgi:hypothetical protein
MTEDVEDYVRQLPKGWWGIARPVMQELLDEGIAITQVKEKFGEIRIYTGPASDEVWAKIDALTELSVTVCCNCGQPGSLRTDRGWYLTFCDSCNAEDKAHRLTPSDIYEDR